MATTLATSLLAIGDIEERATKQYFEGGVFDNLNLEMDDDRSETNWMVLDEAYCPNGTGVRRFHCHSLRSNNWNTHFLPNILAHNDNLSTAIENTLGLDVWSEGREDNAEGEGNSCRRRNIVLFEV
jgi:hypothetical protein